ncbi:MAG: hypothetical protein AB8G11_14490 [Saprospiraceae bacterium]
MSNQQNPIIPSVYHDFKETWKREQANFIRQFSDKEISFIPNLLPEDAVNLTTFEIIAILKKRLGETIYFNAISVQNTTITYDELPEYLKSPVREKTDGNWLKTSNMVGINVRTIQTFWNVVKYALTLPESQDSIHFLPIWEPGVVSSLYGMASWNVNPDFFSVELASAIPHLDTVEKQLKAVINILHALGKSVGMDVIPHTDRFSEMVLSNPHYFEWLQREEFEIVNHETNLYETVQELIIKFLRQYGASNPFDKYPKDSKIFFSDEFGESQRNLILFGKPNQVKIRELRRDALLRFLTKYGYEPVPATMAPPYRGLEVDKKHFEKDAQGQIWREYNITKPESFSRVFGPLTRYKLYDRLNDNQDWEIDFSTPLYSVWNYVASNYYQVQSFYGFDFMRGDMSHVQMRPEGVPAQIDDYYDILAYVKNYIQKQDKPYFGYFAETFLAPRNEMGYGDEIDHLEAADANSTLGDLQSVTVNTTLFLQRFRQYIDILHTRNFAPNFTIMTADKDDPRFDKFYIASNEFRLFAALFLTDMPSYMGLGFRTRDTHYKPAPNEHYTKLFVFQIGTGPKATKGYYNWGKNGVLYHRLLHIQFFAESIWNDIKNQPVQWLIYPDPTGYGKVIAWTHIHHPKYVFMANLDTENAVINFAIPKLKNIENTTLQLVFSTIKNCSESDEILKFNGRHYNIASIKKEECRVYKIY